MQNIKLDVSPSLREVCVNPFVPTCSFQCEFNRQFTGFDLTAQSLQLTTGPHYPTAMSMVLKYNMVVVSPHLTLLSTPVPADQANTGGRFETFLSGPLPGDPNHWL